MKTCVKCKTEKSESSFGLDKLRKDGLFPYCRKCRQKAGSARPTLIPRCNLLGRKYITSNGYIKRLIRSHPLSDGVGRVFEHRMVMYAEHGDGEQSCAMCSKVWLWSSRNSHIDHIDEDRKNNKPSNLRFACRGCNVFRGHSASSMGRRFFTVNGVAMTASAWARMDGVEVAHTTIIRRRDLLGMSDFDAIFSPRKTHHSTKTKAYAAKYDDARGISKAMEEAAQ